MERSNGAITEHFKVGNVIFSNYWHTYDRVISFTAAGANQGWYVTVQHCDKDGNFIASERVRTHCTFPDKRDKVICNVA